MRIGGIVEAGAEPDRPHRDFVVRTRDRKIVNQSRLGLSPQFFACGALHWHCHEEYRDFWNMVFRHSRW